MMQAGWNDVLARGERLLWSDRPAAGIALSDFMTVRLPFGLVFTAFSVFWITAAFAMTRNGGGFDVFPLFGIPFVRTGLHLMIGIPIWEAYERAHSWYALSDRAAYIATELFGRRKLVRYTPAEMNSLELEDGETGTVWFRRDVQVHSSGGRIRVGGSNRSTYTSIARTGFKRIRSPRTVYGMILRLLETADDGAAASNQLE